MSSYALIWVFFLALTRGGRVHGPLGNSSEPSAFSRLRRLLKSTLGPSRWLYSPSRVDLLLIGLDLVIWWALWRDVIHLLHRPHPLEIQLRCLLRDFFLPANETWKRYRRRMNWRKHFNVLIKKDSALLTRFLIKCISHNFILSIFNYK